MLMSPFGENSTSGDCLLKGALPLEQISQSLSDKAVLPAKIAGRTISPSFPNQPVNIEKVRFILPPDFEWKEEYASQLKVNYSLLGLDGWVTERIKGIPKNCVSRIG
jgi:hypothetical protein